MAVGGQQVVELANVETGVGTVFMQTVSRFFATEQIYAENDLARARYGAGFLAVYCPTEKTEKRLGQLLYPRTP